MPSFFYHEQTRRYLLQVIRIFSGYEVEFGKNSAGQIVRRKVPATAALRDRMVGQILRNMSENVILSTPFITCGITGMEYDLPRMQNPNHVSTVQYYEREIDPDTGEYGTGPGDTYTIERFMPVPYKMSVQVDIWTSNEMQKHQLFEQIAVNFNPGVDIQSSDNGVDWTSLTTVFLEGNVWSSRSLEIGTDNAIEISTFNVIVPIWFNPPAKVQQQKIIQQVVTNIGESDAMTHIGEGTGIEWTNDQLLTQVITTPGNHSISVAGNIITLLSSAGSDVDENDDEYVWSTLLEPNYGTLRDGSVLRLRTATNLDDDSGEISGTISYHPTDANKLVWTVDILTLPLNTIDAIDAIINPHTAYPGNGITPVSGSRYLLLDEVGDVTQAWGTLTAHVNDIIEYDGSNWFVAFDASESSDTEYLLNNFTSKQLKWTGAEWVLAVDGEYPAGFWRLSL